VVLNSTTTQTVSAASSFNDLAINDGLVGYWKLNDSTGSAVAADSSGYGRTGTLTSMDANADWVAGATTTHYTNAGALNFDGSDDHVQINSIAPELLGAMTVAAWIKTTDVTAGQYIFRSGDAPSDNDVYLSIANVAYGGVSGKVSFAHYNGSWVFASGATTLTNNTWYHVAATFSPVTGTIVYVNGVNYNKQLIK
jgi:hypothetical protein